MEEAADFHALTSRYHVQRAEHHLDVNRQLKNLSKASQVAGRESQASVNLTQKLSPQVSRVVRKTPEILVDIRRALDLLRALMKDVRAKIVANA